MRKINVKQIAETELLQNWGFRSSSLPPTYWNTELYVKCNKKGEINWTDNISVMNKTDLEKYDYTIIVNLDIEEFIASEQDSSHVVENKKANKVAQKIYKKSFELIFSLMPGDTRGEVCLAMTKSMSLRLVDEIIDSIYSEERELYRVVRTILMTY